MCTCIKCSKHIPEEKINYMHFRPLCEECFQQIAGKKTNDYAFSHEDLQKQIQESQSTSAYFVAVKAQPVKGPKQETWLYMEQGLGPYRNTLYWGKTPMLFDSVELAKETMEQNDGILEGKDNKDWTFIDSTLGIYQTATRKVEDVKEMML